MTNEIKADVIDTVIAADEAIVFDEVIAVDKTDESNEAIGVTEVNKIVVATKANMIDKIFVTDEAIVINVTAKTNATDEAIGQLCIAVASGLFADGWLTMTSPSSITSHSPSWNILQSLQKWQKISE